MKWRDVIIGALASLLVTIAGGVAVYYATKEPDEKKNEKLIYEVNQAAQFTGGEQEISFSALTIRNIGGVAAKNVAILISLKDAEIKDLAINSSIGLREKSRDKSKKSLRVVYGSFMPNEKVTINLILTKSEKAEIDVRSESSLGEEAIQLSDINKASRINKIAEKVVPLSTLIAVLISGFGLINLRKRGILDLKSDQNNTGFLLLHNGLTDEADKIFSLAVEKGRFDQYTLSNFALCKAVKGEIGKADGLLKAAGFLDRSGHSKAVFLFNEALICLIKKDKSEAIDLLKKAINLSPSAIKQYCQKSVLLDGVRSEPAFFDLFKDA